jgi:hypothetical protein
MRRATHWVVLAAAALLVCGAAAARPFPGRSAARPLEAERVVHTPGLPTVYVMTLAGGRTLDLYLDPGRTGLNGVHGTYFDAQGRGLVLAGAPAVTASGPGGRRVPLPALLEGPGHFYTDGRFGPGDWTFTVDATTRAGEALPARVAIRL